MTEERGTPVTRVVNVSKQDVSDRETRLAIAKIMEVVEGFTDYHDLEPMQKAMVRDTIMNQINRLARVLRTKNTMIFNTKNEQK